jgi:hypothetical protein
VRAPSYITNTILYTMYILITMIALLYLIVPSSVFASPEGLFNEEGYALYKDKRIAINPEFSPNKSYMFDAYRV